jgi:hypothetical protein
VRDYRIVRATTKGMEDEDILWAVIEPIWDELDLGEEEDRALVTELTPGQRGLIAVDWLTKEVFNGGIHQFFLNPTGVLAHEALEGFRMMRATRYAQGLETVYAAFPDGRVPRHHDQRQRALVALPEEIRTATFEEFDATLERLMDEDPLVAHAVRYVEAHPGEFFREA